MHNDSKYYDKPEIFDPDWSMRLGQKERVKLHPRITLNPIDGIKMRLVSRK
jgi:hypothetical protein